MPIRTFLTLIAFAAAAPAPAADGPPVLEYRWAGGHSPLKYAAVRVAADGKVTVRFEKQGHKPAAIEFALDPDEVAALRATARAARAFDHPEDGGTPLPDAGESTLTVARGNMSRTLRNPRGGDIELLTQAAWRLVNQGVLTHGLEARGDVYPVSVAASATAAGAKVYSPRLLAGPLKAFVGGCGDKQELEWGLSGLAWVVTEEQWLGFVAGQLEEADAARKPLLLSTLAGHPFYANIPDSHSDALLPLLATELDVAGKPDGEAGEAMAAVCRFLGSRKYERAVPVLTRFAQAHAGTSAGNWGVWAVDAINVGGKEAAEK
ncbi:MAG TPA: hypothetical protein VF590_10635 [Isosphaeraceae bacterium]|jgi:hypothetical protein